MHLIELADPTGLAGQLAVWLVVGFGLLSAVASCVLAVRRQLTAVILDIVGVSVALLLCGAASQEPATVRGGVVLNWLAIAIAFFALWQCLVLLSWWGRLSDIFKAIVCAGIYADIFVAIVFMGRAQVYKGDGTNGILSFLSLVAFAVIVAEVAWTVWLLVGVWRSRHLSAGSGAHGYLSDSPVARHLQRPKLTLRPKPRAPKRRWWEIVVESLAALGRSFLYTLPPPPPPEEEDDDKDT